MSGKTCGNGFIFVAAMCLGLMVANMDAFAATADPGSNWSFAVFGDPQGGGGYTIGECINTNVNRAMCDAIIKDGASFVLVAGDLQHGQEGGYDNFTINEQLPVWTNAVSALGRAGIPYYAVRGNHETYNVSGEAPYKAWRTHVGHHMPTNGPEKEIGMTYSFSHSNALFIGLDMFHGENDSTYYEKINQAWLTNQLAAHLAANTRPHLFVFGHEAAFRTGIWCQSDEPADRNKFWDSIANANAQAYFCGHEHLYARCLASISNGPALRQIIVGTGGGNLNHWKGYDPDGGGAVIVAETHHTLHWGYLLVRVSGNHVDMAYKSTTNALTTWATNDVVEWTTNDTFQYTITATPTNFHASNGNYTDKVLISWDAATDASGYEVWRGTSNGPSTDRARIGVTTNTLFSDTSAVPAIHYHYWVRATNTVGTSLFSTHNTGWRSAVADFDGDGLADPFMVVNGNWTHWLSSGGYLPSGPNIFSVPGGVPLSGHFDGDGLTDPAMVANGGWTFWLSSGGYLSSGLYVMSVPGGVPVAGDFDGDGLADPAMVANGGWTFWLSSDSYLPLGPYILAVPGGVPLTGDFDGDGKSDPVMVANGGWTIWFSSGGYLPSGPYVMSVPGGVPRIGDFDGDGLADPVMVVNNNWTIWFSSGGYLPSGPYLFNP